MENQAPQEDPGKTVAILSYCTLIGLIIALVLNAEKKNKSELGVLHLRQGLGLGITSIALVFVGLILIWIPILGLLINLCHIGIFVLWILGLIAAINGDKKVLPIVGPLYQNMLSGLK
jgi:uncharacterized membrane protein